MNRIILAALALTLSAVLSPAPASTISCNADFDSPFCTSDPPQYEIKGYPVWSADTGEMVNWWTGGAAGGMSPHRSDLVGKPGEVDTPPDGQRVRGVWWVGVVPGVATDISPEMAKCWNPELNFCAGHPEFGKDQP
jgi:hypothetical protein